MTSQPAAGSLSRSACAFASRELGHHGVHSCRIGRVTLGSHDLLDLAQRDLSLDDREVDASVDGLVQHGVEVGSQCGESGSLGGEHDRHRQHLDRKARATEVTSVELDDASPRRLEVDLAHDLDDDWARGARRPQEVELRSTQLLRRVGDEQHRVGSRQRRDGRGVVDRGEPADAGRVHELHSRGEHRRGQSELDELQPEVVVVVPGLGAVVGAVVVGDRRHDRLGADAVGSSGRLGLGCRCPPNQRRDRGRQVLVDRAHG